VRGAVVVKAPEALVTNAILLEGELAGKVLLLFVVILIEVIVVVVVVEVGGLSDWEVEVEGIVLVDVVALLEHELGELLLLAFANFLI
jgi:hypothetical protein